MTDPFFEAVNDLATYLVSTGRKDCLENAFSEIFAATDAGIEELVETANATGQNVVDVATGAIVQALQKLVAEDAEGEVLH